MTWRLSEELLERVRRQAAEQGRSLNDWVTVVLDAASDPATAGGQAERLRERLARAGLLEGPHRDGDPAPVASARPTPERLAQARAAAASGTTLSEAVSDGRG